MSRTVLVVLALSLVANLLLIGFVAGRAMSPEVPGKAPPIGLMWMRHALPPESREVVQPIMRAEIPELLRAARGAHQAREALSSELTSEDFSRENLNRLATNLQNEMSQLNRVTLQTMIDVAEQLPPDQRALLAHGFRGEERRGAGRRGPWRQDRDHPSERNGRHPAHAQRRLDRQPQRGSFGNPDTEEELPPEGVRAASPTLD